MLKTRIIPCLDVIKNKVVKGVNFKNINVMGNAVEMAKKVAKKSINSVFK